MFPAYSLECLESRRYPRCLEYAGACGADCLPVRLGLRKRLLQSVLAAMGAGDFGLSLLRCGTGTTRSNPQLVQGIPHKNLTRVWFPQYQMARSVCAAPEFVESEKAEILDI